MAFVRSRTTRAGTVSTALVESYRDENGKPRQRVLVNLYGTSSTLDALANLAAQRQMLKDERAKLAPELRDAALFYKTVMTASVDGRRFSVEERKEIDPLLRARKRLLKRAEKVDSILARIQKDGAIIRKYCDASQDETQAAIRRYKKSLNEKEMMILGSEVFLEQAKRDFRRMSLDGPKDERRESVQMGLDLLRNRS